MEFWFPLVESHLEFQHKQMIKVAVAFPASKIKFTG